MAPGWVWGVVEALAVAFAAVTVKICPKLVTADDQKFGPGVEISKLEISMWVLVGARGWVVSQFWVARRK